MMISPTNLKSLVPQLRRLIAEQGVTLLDDPMRLRGWLSDLAPDCTAERHLIMTALEERVPQELRRLRKLDKTTFHQLVSRLEVNRSVASERARWAVLEWAEVLGIPQDSLLSISPQRATSAAQSASPQHSRNVSSNTTNTSAASSNPKPAAPHTASSASHQTLPRLSAWDPLSYARLLIWMLWAPQNLKQYQSAYGQKIAAAYELSSLLFWMPFFLLHLAAVLGTLPTSEPYELAALLIMPACALLTILIIPLLGIDVAHVVGFVMWVSVAGGVVDAIGEGEPNLISRAALIALPLSYAAMIWLLFFGGVQTLNALIQ